MTWVCLQKTRVDLRKFKLDMKVVDFLTISAINYGIGCCVIWCVLTGNLQIKTDWSFVWNDVVDSFQLTVLAVHTRIYIYVNECYVHFCFTQRCISFTFDEGHYAFLESCWEMLALNTVILFRFFSQYAWLPIQSDESIVDQNWVKFDTNKGKIAKWSKKTHEQYFILGSRIVT